MHPPFSGALTALITPFRDDIVDEAAFAALIERQIAAGIDGLVPNGTTGESATLSLDEKKRVVSFCVEKAGGRVPVVAGCGSNETRQTIDLTRWAKTEGADAALIVTPYYNRPSQEGLAAHYRAIADSVELPIILYNVPARTGVDLLPETVAALSNHPNIVGIKEASRLVERATLLRRLCGPDFVLLSGDDPSALGFCAMGGQGCISVTANVAPDLCARLHECCAAGDFGSAHEIDRKLYGLHTALFTEPSPGPAKYALAKLGLCAPDVRLPLVPLSDGARGVVEQALVETGLI